MIKKIILISMSIIVLSGCSVEETFEKGKEVVNKVEKTSAEVVNKVREVNTKVNKVTSLFDKNIRKVQNSNVYDEDFTFKELIDATIENPIWESETGTYVTVQGKLKSTIVNAEQLNEMEEVILGFPFDGSSGVSLANAGIFTTIDGSVIVDGTAYELSGQDIVDALVTIYEDN